MTQVVLHYAHTFEIFMFHFQFQSDPTSDQRQPTTYRNVYVILKHTRNIEMLAPLRNNVLRRSQNTRELLALARKTMRTFTLESIVVSML